MIGLILKHRFIFAPPLLSPVVRKFAGLKSIAGIYGLVKTYLPEERERPMAMNPTKATEDFVKAFSKKHFPLHGMNPNYLVQAIPLTWHGLQWNDYEPHQWGVSMLKAQLLAETICACPFEGASRLPVMAEFQKKLGEEKARPLLKLLPDDGYSIGRVVWALHDSPWPGLLTWCQWISGKTGNIWLDSTGNAPAWGKRTVEILASHWPLCLEREKQMKDFDKWLIGQFPENSATIIKYIAKKMKTWSPPLIETLGKGDSNETLVANL